MKIQAEWIPYLKYFLEIVVIDDNIIVLDSTAKSAIFLL
jgi:hypothetical protein